MKGLRSESGQERRFIEAGFGDVCVRLETREDNVASFEANWASIEAGTGLMAQLYRALPERTRREVVDEMRGRLVPFEVDGRYVLSVEMLIASGRA